VGIAGAVASALVCAASTAATAVAAPMPATIAVTTKPIIALAGGGGRVAYRTRRVDTFGDICDGVHVVRLDGLGPTTPSGCAPVGIGPGGAAIVPQDQGVGIAVAARALVYDSIQVGRLNAAHDEADSTLWRVGPHGHRQVAAESYEITCAGSAVAAFTYGGGVAFTRTVMTEVDPQMECQLGSGGGNGVSSMTGTSLRYVPAGSISATTIPGAPGAARLAARWPALAVVPLRLPQAMGTRVSPPRGATAAVESWDLRTRTRRCVAILGAAPTAVATNGAQIVALVPAPQGVQLVRVSAATCTTVGSRTLTGRVRSRLAMGSHVVAWVSGRSVMTLDTATGHVSRLNRGMFVPHGLALTNGRLVWWVNGAHSSRVLRLPLP
jgi:hypothetical protein